MVVLEKVGGGYMMFVGCGLLLREFGDLDR